MSNKRKITYKCPYCDKRYTKEDLVHHVSNKHDDMIPEGYSAFRLVFDYVNKKPSGYNGKCIICGNESGWDEEKGKYNRICSNPACKKKYIQSFEERMMKSKGVTRITSTAEGQAKMLANRKISGEYKFQDGGIRTYTGTYEKKALEFMDKVMNIQSIDVTTPGPIMEYDFEGKKHIYISDIYYTPYNLIIEVKDGGNNPNMRSMPEYRAKQIAKEKYIIKNTDYNYLRLTNNDFSQLLAVFMELKMEMSNDIPERVIRINEGVISDRLKYPYKYGEAKKINQELTNKINSTNYPWYFINITELINSGVDINLYGYDEEPVEGVDKPKYKSHHLYNKKVKVFHGRDSLNPSLRKYSKFNKGAAKTKDVVLKEEYIEEGFLKSEPDILYNKEAFDNGDINICFVTGHSGSGKSTLAHGQESETVEVYELDDLQCIADRFTMANLKEYGDLIYTYFKGPGKQFYTTWDQLKEDMTPGKDYEDKLYPGFVAYAIDWAKKHKDKKYILEGVWLFCNDETGKPYFDPSYFKDYAFYIKGTSAVKSKWRAAKRDMKYDQKEESHNRLFWIKSFTKSFFLKNWKWYKLDEKRINKFRDYFKDKPETVLSEATITYPKKLYFVSKDNMDNSTLQPRIPSNYMTKNNYEENKTPRVCFAPSIDKCLMALGENLTNKKLYVHIVDDISKYEILKPDTSEVPDSEITNEYWICSPVKIKCIGQIICKDTGVTDDGIPYTYGNGKSASLYKWDWEWIKQFDESKDASITEDDFKKKSGKSFKLINLNTKEALKYVSDKWRNGKECRLAICKEDDKLAGYIYWNKSGTIAPLEVYKDYRGYGLSEILMKEAIKNGGNSLGVYSDNEVAIKLYKKLGFVETRRKKYKDGDEVIMMELKSSLNEAYTGELGKIQKDPEIIDSYGFISSDGIYNENVKIKGFNKWLRGRSELLIIDKGKLYLKKDPKKGYSIPGGGWEKDEDHNLSAIRETNEEARIKVKNVNYVSSYVAYFPPKDWVREKISEENWWYGEYIELYIGEYDGQYKGKVEKIDQDKAMESGKFYDIKSVYNDLIPVHQEALSDIINESSISDYEFLDIKSNKSKALEYLKSSTQTKDYADDIIKNYVGEIVLYNDEMIGRIFVGDKKDKGFITDFEINEEHRGNKLGSKLIDDAIIKYHGIDLLVDKDNKIAIDMYKKRGFVVIKTVKNQYWMKLKSEIKEDTNMTEAMNALMTGYIPGSVDNPNNVYIVNYMQNNVFSDEDPNEDCIGVSDNPKFTNLIVRDKDGVLKKVDESFLNDKTYKVYILEMSRDEVSNRLSKYMNTEVDKGFIYETLTGHKLYTNDQIQFESMFIPTLDYYEFMKSFKEVCDNYFSARDKEEMPIRESNFVPREVKHFNKSGLMYVDKVFNLDEFINSKPNKVLEYLDITIKEGV